MEILRFNRYIVFFAFLFCSLYAKQHVLLSKAAYNIYSKDLTKFHIFEPIVENTEKDVKEKFLSGEVKLAIVRSDILYEIEKENNDRIQYYIVSKLKHNIMLLLLSSNDKNTTKPSAFNGKKISIGLLGNGVSEYIKEYFNEYNLMHNINFVSLDPFRSIEAIKEGEIDFAFVFACQKYKKYFAKYLNVYPDKLNDFLSTYGGIKCVETDYCKSQYFLVASDMIGRETIQNIYNKSEPLFSKEKSLDEDLGNYYIHSILPKVYMPRASSKQKADMPPQINRDIKSPRFGRTPWMDIALKEAIEGKGKPENQMPMLDLSYKYIRFSKGTSGITTAPNDNIEGSWCAAYVSWTLDRAGYKVHKTGRMASQSFRYFKGKLYRKIAQPIFGAITLFTNIRKPSHGHVGYLFGKTPSGRLLILGGNQGNRLKFSSYSKRFGSYKLNGFYVPIDYKIKPQDKLTKEDIYPSAGYLNRKFGITGGGGSGVR